MNKLVLAIMLQDPRLRWSETRVLMQRCNARIFLSKGHSPDLPDEEGFAHLELEVTLEAHTVEHDVLMEDCSLSSDPRKLN